MQKFYIMDMTNYIVEFYGMPVFSKFTTVEAGEIYKWEIDKTPMSEETFKQLLFKTELAFEPKPGVGFIYFKDNKIARIVTDTYVLEQQKAWEEHSDKPVSIESIGFRTFDPADVLYKYPQELNLND